MLKRIPANYLSTGILWLAVLGLFLAGEMVSAGFFSTAHAASIFRTASFIGMVAIGQTLVVLTGGIDLSVGSLISLGNVFACLMIAGQDENNLLAFTVIGLIGLAVGVANGVGVSALGISPMVMSLAMGVITTGVTLIYSKGAPTGNASPLLRSLGVGQLWGVPLSVYLWLGLSVAAVMFLKFTTLGQGIYYVGANPTAAVFAGLRARLVIIAAYAVSGVMAVLTGVTYAGYTSVAFVDIGKDFTMSSITAVVIGGTAMTGGRGGYVGTMAGAILLCLIESILTIMNMEEAGKRIINGVVIIVLIAIYYRRARKS